MTDTMPNDSPAALVAIVVAARRAGDRDLERQARRELERRFRVKLRFAGDGKARQTGRRSRGVEHD